MYAAYMQTKSCLRKLGALIGVANEVRQLFLEFS